MIDDTWKVENSRYINDDRWMRLRADKCITRDGHVIEPYYVIEYNDWVNCLVFDTSNKVIMVRQYRHGAGVHVLETTSGGIEQEDSGPLAAISRELKEELGYTARELYAVGSTYANPSNQTNKVFHFLAIGGDVGERTLEKGETDQIIKITLQNLLKRIDDGKEIFQSLHLVGIFFALDYIRRSNDPALAELKKLATLS